MGSKTDVQNWVSKISLSRKPSTYGKEFSDGVLVCEIIHHFLPKLIGKGDVKPVTAIAQKTSNWKVLNKKALKTIGVLVPEHVVKDVVAGKSSAIVILLGNIKLKIEEFLAKESSGADSGDGGDGSTQLQSGADEENSTAGSLPRSAGANSAKSSVSPKKGARAGKSGERGDRTGKPGGGAVGEGKAKPSSKQQRGKTKGGPISSVAASSKDTARLARAAEAESLVETKKELVALYEQVVEGFQLKVRKLESLVKLKDKRIEDLQKKCKENNIALKIT